MEKAKREGITLKKIKEAKKLLNGASMDMRDRYVFICGVGIFKITDAKGRYLKKPRKDGE